MLFCFCQVASVDGQQWMHQARTKPPATVLLDVIVPVINRRTQITGSRDGMNIAL